MDKNYRVVFKIEGVTNGIIKKVMESELIRVYNTYADMCNNGVTESLNRDFKNMCPNYDYDTDINNPKLYYRFMAEGYNRLICDKLNKRQESFLMDFFVDPEECQFKGCLRDDRNATIEFFLREA